MNRCLTDFLSRLMVEMSVTEIGIIVHATSGDVLWRWDGAMWCW